MDRQMSARLDASITRDPPEPEERDRLQCVHCAGFLEDRALRKIEEQQFSWCDGKVSIFEDEHDEGVLAIIGEEHRGEKFKRVFPPICFQGGEGAEIRPEEAAGYAHAAHWYADEWGFSTRYVRMCKRCGARNEEIEV